MYILVRHDSKCYVTGLQRNMSTLFSVMDAGEHMETEQPVPGPETMSDASISLKTIKSGDYVVVEYVVKKSTRRFVGQVTEVKETDDVNEKEYKVLFLRKRDEPGYLFGFPDSVDLSFVAAKQIIEILPEPVLCGRGQFKFINAIKASDQCLLRYDTVHDDT